MILGPFSAFRAPKEGQIFIFDKCVFITSNQYQKTFHLSYCTNLYPKVDIFIVRNFSIIFDVGFVPLVSETLISWMFCKTFFSMCSNKYLASNLDVSDLEFIFSATKIHVNRIYSFGYSEPNVGWGKIYPPLILAFFSLPGIVNIRDGNCSLIYVKFHFKNTCDELIMSLILMYGTKL